MNVQNPTANTKETKFNLALPALKDLPFNKKFLFIAQKAPVEYFWLL